MLKEVPLEVIATKDSLSIQQLMFLTKKEVVNKYGKPSLEEQFVLNDALSEFRIGLMNIYSKAERRAENILIEELTWEKDKTT